MITIFLPGGTDSGRVHEHKIEVRPAPMTTKSIAPVEQFVKPTVVEVASLFCILYSLQPKHAGVGVGVLVGVRVFVGVVVKVGVGVGEVLILGVIEGVGVNVEVIVGVGVLVGVSVGVGVNVEVLVGVGEGGGVAIYLT